MRKRSQTSMYNMVDYISLIGFLAGACTTIAFLPQAVKAWKTKSTKDVSLAMYIILCTGIVLWLVYGLLIGSKPVIIANAVVIVLALSVLGLKLRYK
jgi:MtN3 and saliva related transmembrane protein